MDLNWDLILFSFSGIMSTVMSQQPPKEDEEEEDEEQGEEFTFEDSADEDNVQEDRKGISSRSVQSTEKAGSETLEGASRLGASPPPGREGGIPTGDVAPIPTAGDTFVHCGRSLVEVTGQLLRHS